MRVTATFALSVHPLTLDPILRLICNVTIVSFADTASTVVVIPGHWYVVVGGVLGQLSAVNLGASDCRSTVHRMILHSLNEIVFKLLS